MIILAFDFETTGLDKENDHVIEIGAALYSTERKRVLESWTSLIQTEREIPQVVTEKTGIDDAMIRAFGLDEEGQFDYFLGGMASAEAIATHNGRRFDIPILKNWAKRIGRTVPDLLSIDTMTDLPGDKGEQLITMCAKHGYLIHDAHSAGADVAGVIYLLSCHNMDEVLARARSPLLVVRCCPQYGKNEQNKVARELGFRWSGKYKMWWQAMKSIDINTFFQNKFPFEVMIENSITVEELED